jgi:hypothetical protein
MFHTLIFNIEGRSLSRNLGPYRIAHWLRNKNWDAEVIDYALHWKLDELQELVESRVTKNTKFFGFSFLFGEITETIQTFIVWLKLTYPNIPVISGSSTMPSKHIQVDYHIWGFAETAIDLLLKYLFSNGEQPRYSNMNDINVINGMDYPAYPLDNYSVSYQDRDFIQPWEFLAIETGRGCKFKCSFCTFPLLGVKGDHSTSSEAFERELKENWDRWGVKNYLIAEETFNDRPEKIAKFAKVVSSLDFDPWFSAFIRVDLLLTRKEERHMLKEMKVLGQFYGVESFNLPTAKAVRKGMAPERVKEGLLELKQFFSDSNKYRGTISLIHGAPYESLESLHTSLQWLVDNWKDQAARASPLAIPLDEDTQRHSDLSTSFAKHGYVSVPIDTLEKKHHNQPEALASVKQVAKRNLLWDNGEMDVVDAYEFSNFFQRTLRENNFKKTTFALPEFSGIGSTLEDKLTHTVNQVHSWQKEEFEWYELYKFKKLCWRK